MKAPREQNIVKGCLGLLNVLGIPCWRQNQGAFKEKYRGITRLIRVSSMTGISDILGLLPPNGRFLAIECKRPRKKLSPNQELFKYMVEKAGGIYLLVSDINTLKSFLRDMGYNIN
jgi:hypothetical protein